MCFIESYNQRDKAMYPPVFIKHFLAILCPEKPGRERVEWLIDHITRFSVRSIRTLVVGKPQE